MVFPIKNVMVYRPTIGVLVAFACAIASKAIVDHSEAFIKTHIIEIGFCHGCVRVNILLPQRPRTSNVGLSRFVHFNVSVV